MKHSSESINGLPLSVAISGEFSSVKEFVDKAVNKPNEEASLLILVFAPTVLRIAVDIAIFDAQAQVNYV